MGVFTDALEKLKSTLIEIKANSIKYDESNLSNLNESKQLFADPLLLPEEIRSGIANDSFVSSRAIPNHYTDRAIQAVWNIASISTDIATSKLPKLSAARNAMALNRNFNYLEDVTWVPKIFDDKTYRLGLALNEFLSVATTDKEAKGVLPTNPLLKMKDILVRRLTQYEAHKPKNIKSSLLAYQKRDGLVEQLNTLSLQFNSYNLKDMQGFIHAGYEPLSLSIESTPIAELLPSIDSTIQTRKDLINEIQTKIDQFNKHSEKWFNTIPDMSITSSDFIDLLHQHTVNPEMANRELVQTWRNLFNSNQNPYPINLKDELNHSYTNRSEIYQDSQAVIEICNTQIKLLESQRAAVVAIDKFEGALKEMTMNIPDLVQHDYIVLNDGIPTYEIQLSADEDNNKRLLEDNNTYAVLLENLHSYANQLEKHKVSLHSLQTKIIKYPLPDEATDHEDAFEGARQKISTDLLQKENEASTQLSQINSLITKATDEKTKINSLLSHSSEIGKKKLLEAAIIRVSRAFNKNQAAQNATRTYQQDPSSKQLEKQSLKNSISGEKKRLIKLRANLIRFKTIINESGSVYVPAHLISKDELKANLEASKEIAAFVDELYEIENKSSPFMGVNLFNIYYILNTKTFAPSDSVTDMKKLLNHINLKLKQIEVDLNFNTPPNEIPTTLDILREKYSALINKSKQDESIQLNTQLNKQLLEIDHTQAMIQHSLLTFNFKQDDIAAQQEQLQTLIQHIHLDKSPENALEQIQEHKDLIKEITTWFTFKVKHLDESSTQLNQQLNDTIAWLSKRWDAVDQLNAGDLTPENQSKQDSLYKEFDEIKQKQLDLTTNFRALDVLLTTINEKKIELELRVMITLEQECNQLKNRIEQKNDLNLESLHHLLKDIDHQLHVFTEKYKLLNEPKPSEYENIRRELNENKKYFEAEREKVQQTIDAHLKPAQPVKQEITLQEKLTPIKALFFGKGSTVSGVFGSYLQEREKTYWFRDFCSHLAAFTLGCFGYKTESSERREYVNKLQDTFKQFENEPSAETKHDLNECIKDGLKKFKPRVNEGHQDYQHTLNKKLNDFKQEIGKLPNSGIEQNPSLSI